MTAPLLINGEPWPVDPEAEQRCREWRAARRAVPLPRPRQFDHLEGAPADEDRHFSRVARAMRADEAWWFAYAPLPVTRSSDGWTFLARRADGYNETVEPLTKTSNNPLPVSGEVRAKSEQAKRAVWRLSNLSDDDIALAVALLRKRAARSAP